MPRPLRLEFKNAWYHVMNRGAGYKNIYKSEKHKAMFLELLAEASSTFGIEIHAYCLMDNHYHLLVKTPRANLARAMRHINGVYTQSFNRLEKTDGALFRGRYKAIVVDGDAYLLQVSRYIHLNPAAAKITKIPAHYTWSSYSSYIQATRAPSWLIVNELLSMMNCRKARSAYKHYVEAGLDEETEKFYKYMHTPVIFGSQERKEELLRKIEDDKRKASLADFNRTQELPSIAKINKVCAAYFGLKEHDLFRSCRGQHNEPRKIAIYGCRTWGAEKLASIADYYQYKSHSIVSNIIKEFKHRIKVDKVFAEKIEKIRKVVSGNR